MGEIHGRAQCLSEQEEHPGCCPHAQTRHSQTMVHDLRVESGAGQSQARLLWNLQTAVPTLASGTWQKSGRGMGPHTWHWATRYPHAKT